MCLNETCIRVRIGKYLSHNFAVQNGLKQGDTLYHCFSTSSGAVGKDCQRRLLSRPKFVRACSATDLFRLCFGICHQEGQREAGRTDIEWDISAFGI
jgi:hypothetical protein